MLRRFKKLQFYTVTDENKFWRNAIYKILVERKSNTGKTPTDNSAARISEQNCVV